MGTALALGSGLSNQTGAALGALAFPVIGPVVVVAVRQLTAAAFLLPTVRPSFRGLSRSTWALILGLALVLSVMNLSLYIAIDRIGLGLAVTLEFIGPLGVAILGSRRLLDAGATIMAGVGVVLLTNPGPSTDFLGIGLALLAAVAWAAYILLNRSLGQHLPGVQGTALAGAITAGVWLPIAIVWFQMHPPALWAIGLAVACGVGSSLVPYTADISALRRIPAALFGTLTSVNPVWAALIGLLVLKQALSV